MLAPSVYNYTDPRLFLLDFLSKRQERDAGFSVRKWAREMELKSHSLLVFLLQGKRRLKKSHLSFLRKGLSLDSAQEIYFSTMIEYANASQIHEKISLSDTLRDLNPGDGFQSREVDEFQVIANWEHMSILAMTHLDVDCLTEEVILERLRDRTTIHKVRSAVSRLLEMELLVRGEDGGLKATANRVTSKSDVLNKGVREHHRQMMDQASASLEELPTDRREYHSFSMAVAEDKIAEAKEMIRVFRRQLSAAVSGQGDHVFQTNIQFFQLTSSPAESSEGKHQVGEVSLQPPNDGSHQRNRI